MSAKPCKKCGYIAWVCAAETGEVLRCEVCDLRSRLNDMTSDRDRARGDFSGLRSAAIANGLDEVEVCLGCGKEDCDSCPAGTGKSLRNRRRNNAIEALTDLERPDEMDEPADVHDVPSWAQTYIRELEEAVRGAHGALLQ